MQPGPIPMRSEDRIRRNKDGGEITKGQAYEVTWNLPADPDWHPIAKYIYDACATSGQSAYYQNSDWALLYSICEDISHYKQGSKMVDRETGEMVNKSRSGQMLQSIYSALERLMVAEGDRRRLRVELQAPEPKRKLASVTAIDEAAAALEAD